MKPQEIRTCGYCRHFEFRGETVMHPEGGTTKMGACHRYPRSLEVCDRHWCAEWLTTVHDSTTPKG